jgi:hypothetical protein
MKKLISIPYFINTERTPLVNQLLKIVKNCEDYIRELEEEIRRIKKLPARPKFDKKIPGKGRKKLTSDKRAGSAKAHKTKALPIHEVQMVKVENKPADAKFKGYREFVVQDISIQLTNRAFKCERCVVQIVSIYKRNYQKNIKDNISVLTCELHTSSNLSSRPKGTEASTSRHFKLTFHIPHLA